MSERKPDISCSLVPRFDAPEDLASPMVLLLSVGLDVVRDMLPYPTSARSCITRRAYADGSERLGSRQGDQSGMLLDDLLIDGQPIPSLWVVSSLAPARLVVDGFLGFDCFVQFERVEWSPRTGLIRLGFA